MIFARKIYKIPEFYMTFARKMPEFCLIIATKIFSPNFKGARDRRPLLSVSYAYGKLHTAGGPPGWPGSVLLTHGGLPGCAFPVLGLRVGDTAGDTTGDLSF